METSHELKVKGSPQGCNPILTLGGRVSQGTVLTVLAVAGVGARLVLGWGSLVRVVVSSSPRGGLRGGVLCALGLGASRMGKTGQAAAGTPPARPGPDVLAVKAEAASESDTPAPGNRV